MRALIVKLHRRPNDGGDGFDYRYRCPGCRCEHSFRVAGLSPRYTFNGDMLKPSVEPELVFDWGTGRCVATMSDGELSFAEESTHKLAGQTVTMEAIS